MHYTEKCPACGELSVVIPVQGKPAFVCCEKVEAKSEKAQLALSGAR